MWMRLAVMTVTAAVAAMTLGCGQNPSAPAAVVEDKVYTVTPPVMAVKAGVMTGEVTDMKITERVDKGSGSVVSPAKLTGKLNLKNSSTDQTIRLVGGKIQFIDADGKPMMMDEKKIEPTHQVPDRTTPPTGSTPGRTRPRGGRGLSRRGPESEEAEGDPPRADLHPVALQGETVNFAVSIGGQ